MSYKVILYTEETIVDKFRNFTNTAPIETVCISNSYGHCIDKLIKLKENVIIIFQIFHPVYKIQDFFNDLVETGLSPILIAFKTISENELVYSMTSIKDPVLSSQLQTFFTMALQDEYQCYFNYIGNNSTSNNIMHSRIEQLEKTEYLKDILRGVTDKEFHYYKMKVNLNLLDEGYYLYIWNLSEIEYPDHDLNKNIYYLVGEILLEECREVLNQYNGGEVFYINPTMVCVIVNDIPSNSQATYLRLVEERARKLNNVFNCKTSFRYKSSYIKDIKDIRISYEEYHNLKSYNFFLSEVYVLTYDYIENIKKNIDYESIDELLLEIKELIYHNIADPKLITNIQKLYLDMIKPSLSYNLYYYCYTSLISAITEAFGNEFHSILPKNYSPDKLSFSSIEQQCNNLIEAIHLIKGELSNRHMIKSPLVLEVTHFIQKNYMYDISISYISEKLNISHSYLTQVFTKEMGISPRNYLITYRIQKAKELIIKSNEPIYIIAEEVGFSDVKHFSKTFRKITGLSPSNYKKQYAEAEYV